MSTDTGRARLPGKLQAIATTDTGYFVANALPNLSSLDYDNVAISIDGDGLTFKEAINVFVTLADHPIATTFGPIAGTLVLAVNGIQPLFRWLRNEGTGVGIGKPRFRHP